jgi:hypothetical protein
VWDTDQKVMIKEELYFNADLLLVSKVLIERTVTYACPCSPKTILVPKYAGN